MNIAVFQQIDDMRPPVFHLIDQRHRNPGFLDRLCGTTRRYQLISLVVQQTRQRYRFRLVLSITLRNTVPTLRQTSNLRPIET